MKLEHLLRVMKVVSVDSSHGVDSKKLDKFLSKFMMMSDGEREHALAIRESQVAYLFSLAAKGEFEEIAKQLGLEEPPKSYADALKIISEKKNLSGLYRM